MSTAKKKLFRTEDITEKTVVEATKRLNDVVIKLADHGLERALEVKTELKELKQEMHGVKQEIIKLGGKFDNLEKVQRVGNERLDKLEIGQKGTNQRLDKLEVGLQGTNQRLDKLEIGQQGLRQEVHGTNDRLDNLDKTVSEKLDRQTVLLQQLVENTNKR